MYTFAMGALVVLETSRADYYEQLEQEAESRRIEALPEAERPALSALRSFSRVEKGTVIGRGEYADGAPQRYLVRYKDGAGCQKDEWFGPDAIFEPEVVVAESGAAPGPDGEEAPPARSSVAEMAERHRHLHPVWAVDVGRRPAELVLFGSGGRRSLTDSYWSLMGGAGSSRVSEAEGFAEIYERVYKAERDEEGSTAESAARAANEAVTLFVTIKREERHAQAEVDEGARKAAAGIAE